MTLEASATGREPLALASTGGLCRRLRSEEAMACPKCGCKTVYQFDDEDEPQDDRLQRCAACGEVFDLDDHAEEDDDDL